MGPTVFINRGVGGTIKLMRSVRVGVERVRIKKKQLGNLTKLPGNETNGIPKSKKERYLNISNRLAHSERGLNLLARSFTAFTSYGSESKEEGKRLFLILLQVQEVLNGCPLSNCQEQKRASEQLLEPNYWETRQELIATPPHLSYPATY